MYQTMLRQLLWVCIICILKFPSDVKCQYINPDFDQCDNQPCKEIDKIFEKNIDLYAEPCDDYLKYTCPENITRDSLVGTRLKKVSGSSYGRQDLADLRTILSPDDVTKGKKESPALKMERDIYKKCRRGTHTIKDQEEYKKILRKSGGIRLEPNERYEVNPSKHWSRADHDYGYAGFGYAFFDIDIVEDETLSASKKRYIQISPTSDEILPVNDLLILRYISNPNIDEDRANRYAKLKNFVEKFTSSVRFSTYDKHEPIELQSIRQWNTTYNENMKDAASRIDWLSHIQFLLKTIGKDTSVNEYEPIIVKNKDYFFRLADFLDGNDMETITNYVHLRFISKSIGFAYKEYEEKYSILPRIKELKCTPGLMLGAIHEYMQTYFPKETKETVDTIFLEVKGTVDEILGSSDTNSLANTNKTKEFLRNLKDVNLLIGYPNWLSDATVISKLYQKSFSVQDNYFSNQYESVGLLLKNKMRSYFDYSLPIFDLNAVINSFTQRNIEFSLDRKEMVLPVRTFSENNYKFLSWLLFDPINYGAAGTTIATEIYTEYLKKISYFYKDATECIKREVPNSLTDQEKDEYTLKAVAHLLGLHTAYEAWKTKDSYPIQFPNFGSFTDYRLFFVSYAESICETETSHIPKHLKPYNFVNFAVSNLEEFTYAFVCSSSHRLNRKNKCNPLLQ